MVESVERLVEVDGRKLSTRTWAHPGKPTVVLEAGGSSSSVCWRHIEPEIAQFAGVFSYDRAGYGGSDPVLTNRSFDDMARDLRAALDACGLTGPFILVGPSMGGVLVRRFVSLSPSSVAGVLLLDAVEEQHTHERLQQMRKMRSAARVAQWLARFGVIRLLLELFPERANIPANLLREQRKLLISQASRPSFFAAAYKETAAYFKAIDQLALPGGFGRLGDIPLLVVTHGIPFTGQQEFLEDGWLDAQRRLASLSTRGKLITAAKSGHGIAFDEPELVVELVRRLVDQVSEPEPAC